MPNYLIICQRFGPTTGAELARDSFPADNPKDAEAIASTLRPNWDRVVIRAAGGWWVSETADWQGLL